MLTASVEQYQRGGWRSYLSSRGDCGGGGSLPGVEGLSIQGFCRRRATRGRGGEGRGGEIVGGGGEIAGVEGRLRGDGRMVVYFGGRLRV